MSQNQTLVALQELIDVVAQLRSPLNGCPWDVAQTSETLIPHAIEEAYELVDAIQTGDQKSIAEELGDVLLQVVLHAQIASETGNFSLLEVTQGITQKLIRRHPHVFGDQQVGSLAEVEENWQKIKAAEKGQTDAEEKLSDRLSRYKRSLPPLQAALKISDQAATSGLEWKNIDHVWEKFFEELEELEQAIAQETPERQEEELGDLLFALIQLARWYKLDPSAALQGTSQRLIQRVQKIESLSDRPLTDYSLEELDALWEKAKAKLAQEK